MMQLPILSAGPHRIAGPVGHIEAVVDLSARQTPSTSTIAIICHPLPTAGGTMHHKVVTTMVQAFIALGVDCVRFHFRGTGASAGVFDNGQGEQEDLLAVLHWVRQYRSATPIWLAGFSFGAYVSWCVSRYWRPDGLLSIALPVGRWPIPPVFPLQQWVIIHGEEDELIAMSTLTSWLQSLPDKPRLVTLPNASHFFHGQLLVLRQTIQQQVSSWSLKIQSS